MENQQVQTPQQPPIATPPSPAAHKSSLLPKVLGATLLLGIGALIGYFFAVNTKPTIVPATSGKAQIVPTDIAPTTVHEPSFAKLDIIFRYPHATKLLEERSNDNVPSATVKQNTVRFSLNGKEFVFERITASQEDEAPYIQTSVVKDFNGTTWKVVSPSQTSEYCDAGNCSRTAPSYYVYKNGYRYSFIYYSDDLQPTIEEILSTTSFTN